jgi:hypothetical protein
LKTSGNLESERPLHDKGKGSFSQGREEVSAEGPGAKERRKMKREDPQIMQNCEERRKKEE